MTRFQYIFKSFIHYFKANLLVAMGVAISTMVLTGSLIIGDSVRHSLTQATFYRLGETTHQVSVVERYFRQEMAAEMERENQSILATPILLLEAVAVADGGQLRANKVQVTGIDTDFYKISRTHFLSELKNNEIAVSENLAERLQKREGDNILVRVKKASLIPMNAPFVSAEETSVALRATIKHVIGKQELGRFSLKNSQTAPYNIFVSIDRLNELMEFEGKANNILISTEAETEIIAQALKKCLKPEDAGLSIKTIEATNGIEVSTERVFLEAKVTDALKKLPEADLILTYFVNAIAKENGTANGRSSIPYSFVSSINKPSLGPDEIILNQWAAEDLNAKIGDKVILRYFEIGPLRKLIDSQAEFKVKQIVPMDSRLADPTRVPHLPGLSDAGHCREWEAGVPIDLDAILDKDEKYWDDYKGTPKAFISSKAALALWSNRFGNYTAVRFPAASFNEEKYKDIFSQEIRPEDLGMLVEPIRAQGVQAAQNGTDFSGLFIGLSFFLLAASLILTSLLFRFNLQNRQTQVGSLSALGFRQKQIQSFFLLEGLVIAISGGLVGLVMSDFYTRLIFRILNTLWFDIVRTNVLEISILPETLITGLFISIFISLVAIFISIRKFQNRHTAELQKQVLQKEGRFKNMVFNVLLALSLLIALGIFASQLFSEQLNPPMFFLSGGLMLVGLLLLFRKILVQYDSRRKEFRFDRFARINLSRNVGRSSTVVILFALGTFLVVSTGSNKLDLFANATDKSSGTGGFMYFAETTMPVLFDINDENTRAKEGIYEDFRAVQFRKVEGDDASCLNLNRIAQPAILGVDPDNLKGRFSFAAGITDGNEKDHWMLLNDDCEDGTIPAIADQTVIQWGLGMKVGDVIMYQNELGDTLRLKLVAGTTPSIFQGFVIISDKYFLENYPTSSGSNLFLIDGNTENEEIIGEELQSVFRDYGWEMQSSARRLVEFYSVTNTYLSIFLALGALGLILGTIGLAVILARTILERSREIAVMQAVGFTEFEVFRTLVSEYLILLFSGVLIGFITAVVATIPSFLSTNTDVSVGTVVIVVSMILLNGFLWITGLSWVSLQKKNLVKGLTVEE